MENCTYDADCFLNNTWMFGCLMVSQKKMTKGALLLEQPKLQGKGHITIHAMATKNRLEQVVNSQTTKATVAVVCELKVLQAIQWFLLQQFLLLMYSLSVQGIF